MKPFTSLFAGIAVCMGMALPAFAEDRQAVIIANKNYSSLRDVTEAVRAVELARDLRAKGFTVSVFRDLDAKEMRRASSTISRSISQGDRVLVFISGNFVSGAHDAFLLGTDSAMPTRYTAGTSAMSVYAIMDHLATDAGRAVLMIGEAKTPFRSSGLPAAGVGQLDVPQGVTVFAGPTFALGDFARKNLLAEGISMREAVGNAPSVVRTMGYVAAHDAFIPAQSNAPAPAVDPQYEQFVFSQAQDIGTEAALNEYIRQFPDGQFLPQARAMIADLSRDPVEVARDTEQAMRLSRTDKRAIQEELTLLGFSTNGVDGIFGNGTRNAVRRWERANDLDVTGYLDRSDLDLLAAAASVERKKIEREDAAYWRQTGRQGSEAGYRAYLKRYPNGLFAELAREEIAVIEEDRRALEAEDEQNAWDVARARDTADAYEDFLAEFPAGANADRAKARLAALNGQSGAVDEQTARATEAALLKNQLAIVLVERRMAQIGFNPGRVDGRFDDAARRAIAKFQQSVGLPATGYFDARGLAALMNN